ncbi:MAG: tripartite tricarboxylate transporter substrate binding protein [Acetobacteraceae bacterium]|nr:tripartite tricarboxylate transporter substrate binding protein [Acetobacteraceae bacterium]
MQRRAFTACLLAAPLARAALAQAPFPNRPVRIVVAFPAGGGTDIIARMLQDPLQAALGGTVIIENRSGSSGMIAAEHIARSAPDGYSLLMNITTHVQAPVVLRRFPYEPIKDFSFIARVGTGAITFMVGPAVPASVTTLAEFVAWGRGRPLSFGNFGSGSTGHAFAVLLAKEAGLDVAHVAYRGEAPMLQDNLGGQIHGAFHGHVAPADVVRDGLLRPLGSGGPVRVAALGGRVPTLVELGYSRRFEFRGFTGVLAPARLPPEIAERLVAAFRQVLTDPQMERRLAALDVNVDFIGGMAFQAYVEQLLHLWQEMAESLDLFATG